MTKADGERIVGELPAAGKYVASIDGGYGMVQVEDESEVQSFYLSGQYPQMEVILHDGQRIFLRNTDSEDREVSVYLQEEFD